jgi:REP element-mobilizing transposase RayT
MPRKPRIEFAGAVYHVLSRGDRREAIFRDDRDYALFLDTLSQACLRTGWVVHSYVLLGNHYHVLLETPEANLVVGMKWLQGTYTQRFNRRHRESGHLFQGRYKALLVDPEADTYFSTVSTYIHLNPVRTKWFNPMQDRLGDYPWSSYPYYIGSGGRPGWLCTQRVLSSHGILDDQKGRLWYERYIRGRVSHMVGQPKTWEADPDWSKLRQGWYFGGNDFREKLLGKLDTVRKDKKASSHSGPEIQLHDESQALKLLKRGLKRLGLSRLDMPSLPKGALEKQILAWYIRSKTTVSNQWLSEHLNSGHPANISRYLRNVSQSIDRDVKRLKDVLLKCED